MTPSPKSLRESLEQVPPPIFCHGGRVRRGCLLRTETLRPLAVAVRHFICARDCAESQSLRGFLDRGPVDYRREPPPGNRSAAQPVAERREGQRMVLDIEDKDDLRFLVREPRARLAGYARRNSLGRVVVHAVP